MKEQTISEANDTIAAICLRYYGYSQGTTEAVYAANPHLHQYGALLPYGVVITMPTPPAKSSHNTLTLW